MGIINKQSHAIKHLSRIDVVSKIFCWNIGISIILPKVIWALKMRNLFKQLEFNGFGPSKVLPEGSDASFGQIKKTGPGGLKHQVRVLVPKEPGIYGIVDSLGILIYVGKAKNLRKRLQSYFLKKKSKEKKLIRKAEMICWQTCFSEFHSFLREIEVINMFLPYANIMGVAHRLRPVYLVITSGHAPALKLLKKIPKNCLEVHGPFNSSKLLRKTILILNETLGLRDCPEKTPMFFSDQKSLLGMLPQFGCIRNEIGNCMGPCAGGCSREEYFDGISELRNFLKGDTDKVLKMLNDQMLEFAGKLKFELADVFKQRMKIIEKFSSIHQKVKDSGKINCLYWQKLADGRFLLNFIKDGVLMHAEVVEKYKISKPLPKLLIEKVQKKIINNNVVSWISFQKLIIQRWFKKMNGDAECIVQWPLN